MISRSQLGARNWSKRGGWCPGCPGGFQGVRTSLSDLTLVWDWNSYIDVITFNWLIFLMKHALHFATKLNSRDVQKCIFWGTLLWSVRLCSQSSNSRANSDRRSQIEKHVAVSVRNNLPQKSSTVLSEPKFGPSPPPNKKFLDPPLGLIIGCSFSFSGR